MKLRLVHEGDVAYSRDALATRRFLITLEDDEFRCLSFKAYLQCAPGASPHFDRNRDAPLTQFEKVALRYPVFRIVAD